MNEQALPDFSALMLTLGRYYNKTLSTEVLDTYWHALKRWPWVTVEKAVRCHLQDPQQSRFFPSPAVLMAALPDKSAATQAWQQVSYAIQHVGRYSSVAFADKRIHVALQALGGWCRVCEHPRAQLETLSYAFYQHFNALPHPVPQAPACLAGLMSEVVAIGPLDTMDTHPLDERSHEQHNTGGIQR